MITIIHSSQERYIREAKTFEARLTTLGFKVKRSMIAVASDIPATVRLNRKTNQVFFILKDNLLASSIQILLKVARERSSIVVASDNESVKAGACAALSIPESEIGGLAAKPSLLFLQKKQPLEKIQSVSINQHLKIFLNSSCKDSPLLTKKYFSPAALLDHGVQVLR